jgi:hypothetical protein
MGPKPDSSEARPESPPFAGSKRQAQSHTVASAAFCRRDQLLALILVAQMLKPSKATRTGFPTRKMDVVWFALYQRKMATWLGSYFNRVRLQSSPPPLLLPCQ